MMNLKFNARKIAEIEDSKDLPLANIIQDFKLSTLALFIENGGEVNREESYKKIDEYFASGKSLEDLFIDVFEAVQRDGFLPKEINFKKMRTELIRIKKDIK